jgi:hypothetical protein
VDEKSIICSRIGPEIKRSPQKAKFEGKIAECGVPEIRAIKIVVTT